MTTRHDKADLIGGCGLCALGAFILIYGLDYEVGALRNLGPGAFPRLIGLMLTGLGAAIALGAWLREGPPIEMRLRPLIFIVAALLFFAVALRPLGLILTTAGTTLLASLASELLSWRGRLSLMAVVAALAWLIFAWALRMTLPLWPSL